MCDSDVYMTVCRKNPCNLYHPQVCSTNSRGKVCKWGKDVNLDIYIMMYRDIAMKIINADMTDTMIIMVTKITVDMEMAWTIPGAMSSRMADIKINECSTCQIFTGIII